MRLIFAGTPEFAAVALRRLCGAGFDVALALTQPDRPAGRGMKLQESPVKLFARERGIAVCQPRSLRLDGKFAQGAEQARQAILAAQADVMVVAAYGLILPQWVLDAMRRRGSTGASGLGCVNIHASLLPRWRGAAPIHRAIEAGDAATGVCIMQMDAGLDTGPVLLREQLPIRHQAPHADTTGSLHDKLASLGADLIVRALERAESGAASGQPQFSEGVSYADKVQKAHAHIDWSRGADQIERSIRAFDPLPGAWTTLGPDVLKLWRAQAQTEDHGGAHSPGTILAADDDGIVVACGRGALRLHELQRAGGKRLSAADFLRGLALHPGMRLGEPVSAA